MSARLVGQVLEHYPFGGSEFTLAIVLADEAQHSGGIMASTIKELARLSRQSENNARRLLQKMEDSGWLICLERSKGGHKRPSVYQINPDWVRLPVGFQFDKQPSQDCRDEPSKPSQDCRDEPSKPSQDWRDEPYNNPPKIGGFPRETTPDSGCVSSLFKSITPYSPPNASGSAVPSATAPDESEEMRLARWMFDRVLRVHPKHREPSWPRWMRCIGVMVRKGRTVKEIAELFAWANADEFWRTNIRSPDKLWKHWDSLVIRRAADQGKQSTPPVVDPVCEHCRARPWTRHQKGKGHFCGTCAEQLETAA